MLVQLTKDVVSGRVHLRFAIGWTLWVLGTWVSALGWRVSPELEGGMKSYVRMKDFLGHDPSAEEMGVAG